MVVRKHVITVSFLRMAFFGDEWFSGKYFARNDSYHSLADELTDL